MSSTRTASASSAAHAVPLKFGQDNQPREFFWGVELSKDKAEHQWNFEEEDEDQDYLQHTLFLRHALSGKGLKEGERNVIEVETKDFAGTPVKLPLVVITGGKTDMVSLDINFSHEIAATFRLVEGSGPIVLNGQQLVEFPAEEDGNETEYSATETEDDSESATGTEDTEGVSSPEKKGKKRKASVTKSSKHKKGKTTESSVDEEEDEEMESEEGDEESDEEEETEDEKPKKKSKKVVKSSGKVKGSKKKSK